MKSNRKSKNIYQKIIDSIDAGDPFVLATILGSAGSTPRKAGVKAVIDQTGKIWGTLGGGAVEAEAQERAVEVCWSHQPRIVEIKLEGTSRADDVPICGGVVRILLDPAPAKDRALYAKVAEAIRQRKRGVLLTSVVGSEQTRISTEWLATEALESTTDFPGPEEIASCLKREDAKLFLENSPESCRQVLVEPVFPKPLLLIIGGGHIGQSLAAQGVLTGFDIAVLDDRAEFTDAALFPEETVAICGNMKKLLEDFPVEPDTYIVIVTHGHQHDAEALEACIHRGAAYVGMIGSKRKIALIRKDFIESGITSEDEFHRVFAPIGVDIGSVTVPEIAASIVAELIAVRRRGADWALQNRKGSR